MRAMKVDEERERDNLKGKEKMNIKGKRKKLKRTEREINGD